MQQNNKYMIIIRTIIISCGAFLVNCAVNLLLPPFITKHVGTEAYGFVSLAKNFAQYALIITMALNSFAARHIAVSYHKNEIGKANIYFSSAFFGDAVLGPLIFAVMATATVFLEHILNIPAEIVTDVKLLFLFISLNFLLITMCNVFGASALIKNKLQITEATRTVSYLFEAGTLLFCYFFFKANVFYVGVGILIQNAVVAAANIYVARKYTPDLKIKRSLFSFAAVKKLVIDGIWTSLNSLGEALNNGLDLLVCNMMLTPLAMGQLAIAKTIHGMFSSLLIVVGQAFQPAFLKSYSSGNKQELLGELKFSMKVSSMFTNILYAGFAALGMQFYALWISGQDIKLIYQLTMIENIAVISTGCMFPLFYVYFLTVKKKVPTIITILGGLANVTGMYISIRYFHLGVHVVVITTAIVVTVINFISNPLYMAHVLDVHWTTFYPEILRNMGSFGLISLVFIPIGKWLNPQSWRTLLPSILLLGVIGAVIHILFVFNMEEKKKFLRIATAKIRRR